MRFEWRSLPSRFDVIWRVMVAWFDVIWRVMATRFDVIWRVMAAALLAWFLDVSPGHVEFLKPLGSLDSDAAVWVLEECGIVVLVAAIGAYVEKLRGRRKSNAAMAVLAYMAARALSGGLTHPGFLSSWSPYPMSDWLRNADFLLLGVFVQAWILRPLFPVFVCNVGKIRKWAAVILCALPFLLWDWLRDSVGSASAALICALALVLAMVVAGRRALVVLALVCCSGFLTVSAFVQHERPQGVLVESYSSAPDIDFHIALPPGDDTSGLNMTANVGPGAPTLFGCPTQVHVFLSLIAVQPSNPKDMPQYLKLLKDLKRAPYTLDVSGVTQINGSHLASAADKATSSQVIDTPPSRSYVPDSGDGTHTEWRATGFVATTISSPTIPGLFDILDFSLPLQSWRGMGTCYVTIPRVNQEPSWAGKNYPTQPASATVSLLPGTTSMDLTNTLPRPADQPVAGGTYNWTCFDHSHPGSGGVAPQCPAITVMTAGWSAAYPQVVLLVVGALIAIVAEYWFSAIHPEKPEEEDADPPPGDGHTSGMDAVPPIPAGPGEMPAGPGQAPVRSL